MINWSEVAPALKAVFSGLAVHPPVTPDFRAQWADERQEFVHAIVQKALTLRVTRVADVLIEHRYAVEDEQLTEQLYGMKEFTLEVRCDSHAHVQDDNRWAWSMIERVRTGLLFQRSIKALLDVGVGLVDVSDSRDISFKFDKHIVPAAMFEATFNAAFCQADPVPLNWFEHVAITSQIQGPDGVTLPSPPNVTNLVIPGPDPTD